MSMPEWERDWIEFEATHMDRELTSEEKELIFNREEIRDWINAIAEGGKLDDKKIIFQRRIR